MRWSCVAFVNLLCIQVFGLQAVAGLPIGVSAPAFALKDAAGTAVDSATLLKGKVGIVTFFRLDQDYSNEVLTDLEELKLDFNTDDLRFVGILSGSSQTEKAGALAEELGVTFPVLMDPDRSVYSAYKVFVTPATYVIDKSGKIRFYKPSHPSNFLEDLRLDTSLLLGLISEELHASRMAGTGNSVSQEMDAAQAHIGLGKQLLRRGDRQGAIDRFRLAWGGEKKSIEAGRRLGMLLLEDHQDAEALTVFSELAQLAPDLPTVQGGFAVALIRNGEEAKGKDLLKSTLEKSPDEPYLYYEMGLLAERDGDGLQAIGYFKKGLETALSRE